VVLGGDIGSGKSALALGLALRTAQQGTGVALFSGEMDEERLMERALAIEGRATVDELRSAKLNDQTRAGIGGAAVRLSDLPLTILRLAAPDFETAAERLDPLRQLGLVVVDYLQLVPSPRGVARSTQDEDLALVLQRLKALALERQVALVVVSQLPRFDAKRPNARPALDDFGHLGAIKQHADVVLGLYREEMYNPGHGVDGATELIVKTGTGELEGVTYDEVTYEAYGPGGAALLIEATTDNANRTVAEIRNAFQRHGGNLGATNSVAWMFDRKAQITVDATRADEDAVMEAALDAGADDMARDGDVFLITGPAGQLLQISERLKAKKIAVQTAEIALIPKSTVKV